MNYLNGVSGLHVQLVVEGELEAGAEKLQQKLSGVAQNAQEMFWRQKHVVKVVVFQSVMVMLYLETALNCHVVGITKGFILSHKTINRRMCLCSWLGRTWYILWSR